MRRPPLLLLLQVDELLILSFKNSTLARKNTGSVMGRYHFVEMHEMITLGKDGKYFLKTPRMQHFLLSIKQRYLKNRSLPVTKEGVAEKPPGQPGGGTEPEKAAWKSGFAARGRLSPL